MHNIMVSNVQPNIPSVAVSRRYQEAPSYHDSINRPVNSSRFPGYSHPPPSNMHVPYRNYLPMQAIPRHMSVPSMPGHMEPSLVDHPSQHYMHDGNYGRPIYPVQDRGRPVAEPLPPNPAPVPYNVAPRKSTVAGNYGFPQAAAPSRVPSDRRGYPIMQGHVYK